MSSMTPLLEGPMVLWSVQVPPRDVVFVKGVFEASNGAAAVFAEPRPRGAPRDCGTITIAAPESSAREAERILNDLRAELGAAMCVERVVREPSSAVAGPSRHRAATVA